MPFFCFKNLVPQIFYSVNFGRFAVLWLFLYGDYVRVKRVCANPLYQLPRRPRKWSLRDCLPPAFALTHQLWFVPDKTQPCQTSLFAMLSLRSCQHIANVAKWNTPIWFARNKLLYLELTDLSFKANFSEIVARFRLLKTLSSNFLFFSFGRFVVWSLFLYGDYVRVKRVCANPLYQLSRRPRKWSRCDCLPPSFAVNAPAVICSWQNTALPNIPVCHANLSQLSAHC